MRYTQIADEILIRYESQAADHRKLFRLARVGEARFAKKLDQLLDSASEKTQWLGAIDLAGKYLRLAADGGQQIQGIQIYLGNIGQDQEEDTTRSSGDGSVRFGQQSTSKRKLLESLEIKD